MPQRDTAGPKTGRDLPALVGDLLAQLTDDEKVAMLHQASPTVERLGLAPFTTGAEVLHGVAWLGRATMYPQPVGLAAGWDPDLLRRVGAQVGIELRAKQAADATVSRNVWAPVVNPLRNPLWGRNEEGYSEDPHLTAELAAGYALGLRGEDQRVWRTVPTLKHFLAYNNETDRAVTSSQLRPRVLHEYELPAYRGPIEAGVVGAVMPSYNLVNGRPNHVARELLEELRSWTDQSLLVVSDAGAPTNLSRSERYHPDPVEAHAAALLAGVDSFTDNGPDAAPPLALVREALERGLISMTDVDRAVERVLTVRARSGEFDPADPDAAITAEHLDLPEHRDLAREAAGRAVVLLRNSGVLPLTPSGSVAVIGPLSGRVLPDWYAGTPPYTVSIADAVRARWGGTDVTVVDGSDRIALRSVSTGAYLRAGADQVLVADAPGAVEDALWDVTDWGHGVLTLAAASTGLLLRADGEQVVADATRPQGWVVGESWRARRHSDDTWSFQHIGTGRWLRVEAYGGGVGATAASPDEAERFVRRLVRSGTTAAAAAAADADVVLCVVGNDPHLLGRETQDRPGLDLPSPMAELWRTVQEANPAAVLVLVSSYPYALDAAARDAAAIVWTCHGGQEAGNGLLDVLLGEVEPSGRLPQTWWAAESDAGDLLDYDILGSGTTYWYSDAEPLFAFGHGLTYSRIGYDALTVETDDAGVLAHVTVSNAGDRVATEVVQVYTDSPGHPVPFPRRLAAHARVRLAPGERRTVELRIPAERFSVWDTTRAAMVVLTADYRVLAGPNAADTPLVVRVARAGEPVTAHRLPLRAIDFDTHSGTRIEEATPATGEVVTAPSGSGWLGFTAVADLAEAARLTVARTAPGPASVTLETIADGGAYPFAQAEVPAGLGRHELTEVTLTPIGAGVDAGPTQDELAPGLRVVLAGPVRLATIEERTSTAVSVADASSLPGGGQDTRPEASDREPNCRR
ncbi:glycoside hydrolase family 3 C-terminal domain-containing protein [Occultella aeris]|uniref:Xylan 1,4-beta-xylosidase n=1 Tax=Occultella aeris TaxID=2761496 RepID=A0A7M4DMP7_9MICO|nr:glycoside hydrolase family 3 C-terminal domain-containing protein [Occultella aeris]VZO38692.1 Xylan 1,4-beta-xylosidase precursor [Occultella aeris]